LIPLLFVSCITEQLEESPVEGYFQVEYINYAWAYNHSGFTVTPQGEILSFDKTTTWTFAENGVILTDSLNKNLDASVKLDTLIGQGEMEIYKKLAVDAVSGKLSEPIQVGADMGACLWKIIIPEKENALHYREILLNQTGDFEKHNLAPEAEIITAWLTRLRDDLF